MNILHVVGARPNFMKVAPVVRALDSRGFGRTLVHTGQHFDANMSEVFFGELELPSPDVNLEVGPQSAIQQIAAIMSRLETVVLNTKPDWMFVYGDVSSVVAGVLVATKLGVPAAHVEAGLRSYDRTMPEEMNRLITDQVSDLLFTPSLDGNENLLREGIAPQRIHLVGNVMIDTLVRLLPKAEERWARTWSSNRGEQRYGLVTLHRPSNVDDPSGLRGLMAALLEVSEAIPLIFPVHPRTRQRLAGFIPPAGYRLELVDPLGYLDFLALQCHAGVVITDSGGIQEETTYLGVPCITLRDNTERPITATIGTNRIVGKEPVGLLGHVQRAIVERQAAAKRIPLWDGLAAERVADVMAQLEKSW